MPPNRLKNEKRWNAKLELIYRDDKYTKPKRKEATPVEYNLAVKAQEIPQPTKRLQK